MKSSGKYSLKIFVYRVLARRLIITALIIAAAFVLLAFFTLRGEVSQAVIERALQRTELFNSQNIALLDVPGLPDHQALEQAAETMVAFRIKERRGHFVLIDLYDKTGTRIAKFTDADHMPIAAVKNAVNTMPRRFPKTGQFWHEILRMDGIPYIHIVAPLANRQGEAVAFFHGVYAVSAAAIADARRRSVRTMLAVIGIVFITAALLYPVIINLTRKLTTYSLGLLDSNLETLKVLGSAIAKRDSDTDAHNYRVTIYAVRLAEAVRLSDREIQGLLKGAFLHDVGKIGIRDDILLKPARLSEAEFEVMKTHVDHGLDIVARSAWLKNAIDVVGSHHEKVDGSGYPNGSKGTEIPITARIFAIADVFDALTSKRPYKEPLSFEESMAILEKGRGSHFDPSLLDAFAAIAERLYQEFSGREDDGLRRELKAITQRYFTAGIDSLAY